MLQWHPAVVDVAGMREWFGRVFVGGTVVMIVGGLWTYASLRKIISQEKRVYFPAAREPLPSPPPGYDVQLSNVFDTRD